MSEDMIRFQDVTYKYTSIEDDKEVESNQIPINIDIILVVVSGLKISTNPNKAFKNPLINTLPGK